MLRRGGTSPEELEMLMEDALVLRDGDALADLFETMGMLVTPGSRVEARGRQEIAMAVNVVGDLAGDYLAAPRSVFRTNDIALLIGSGVTNIARRGEDRSWRFVVSVLDRKNADGNTDAH